jgi:hypothetical protein
MTILDHNGEPITPPPESPCDHGVSFDPDAARNASAQEVRRRWPRLFGVCPKGCGYSGIAYASYAHYLMGDW